MVELIWKVEAILFAAGQKVPVQDIIKLSRSSQQEVEQALNALVSIYKEREGALMVFQEGRNWKLTVKERYLPLVRNIVAETELSKATMETLAVIAWKAPIKQSDLVDIRSNKAYEHIAELVESDFITKEKYGRTYLVKLTQKFYDYFELDGRSDIEKRFKKFEELEKRIVPQKQMEAFVEKNPAEEEREKQQKRIEFEQAQEGLTSQVLHQRDEDQGFLDDIGSRIEQVGKESDETAAEFSSLRPTPDQKEQTE
ncbi:MAG: SMC-Scp complex subunit ScpB [Nanoarchaeota archaeon]